MENRTVVQNYRKVFDQLDNYTEKSFDILKEIYKISESVLIRHEVAYVLGQLEHFPSIDYLFEIADNVNESEVTRHEAVEALSSIIKGNPELIAKYLSKLASYIGDKSKVLSETAILTVYELSEDSDSNEDNNEDTLKKVKKSKNEMNRLDPVSIDQSEFDQLKSSHLKNLLFNCEVSLPYKYKVITKLREFGSEGAHILCEYIRLNLKHTNKDIVNKESPSALIKHEIAFILAQIGDKESVDCLEEVVKDKNEHDVVRHEAAISLGTIVGGLKDQKRKEDIIAFLESEIRSENDDLVVESCVVAIANIKGE
eukprot:GAHX01001547.1.p1 GENE.GAHX01001547.1~~GAHX01001547.1.p1  ORF type:complete len:312 (-),score=72.70 GAHX01001547.1:2106-3041(-)